MKAAADMLVIRAATCGKRKGADIVNYAVDHGATQEEAASAMWRMLRFGCLRLTDAGFEMVRLEPTYDDLVDMVEGMRGSCEWLMENAPCSYPQDLFRQLHQTLRK